MNAQPDTAWREHRERLYHFVLGRVHDAAEAEDIVHDVLVRAYQRRDTLRDVAKVEPWLYQVTRNAIIDHYRARRPTEQLPDNLPDAESEEGHAARAELSRCIQPFIESLPARYRDAVQLSEISGLTQQATADVLGVTLSGAKSRVQRGRRMLADMMLECCKVEFDSTGAIMSYEGARCPREGAGPAAGCSEC